MALHSNAASFRKLQRQRDRVRLGRLSLSLSFPFRPRENWAAEQLLYFQCLLVRAAMSKLHMRSGSRVKCVLCSAMIPFSSSRSLIHPRRRKKRHLVEARAILALPASVSDRKYGQVAIVLSIPTATPWRRSQSHQPLSSSLLVEKTFTVNRCQGARSRRGRTELHTHSRCSARCPLIFHMRPSDLTGSYFHPPLSKCASILRWQRAIEEITP